MKTLVAQTVILMLILSSCSNKIKETTTVTNGIGEFPITEILKGKVKEVSEINYLANVDGDKVTKGAPALKKFLDSLLTGNFRKSYNEVGLLLKAEYTDDKNEVYSTSSGTIENGKYKKWDVKSPMVSYYIIPNYDNQGHISGGDVFLTKTDTIVQKFIQSNDSKGKMISIKFTNLKGETQGLSKYKYDTSGNLLEGVSYNGNDSLLLKVVFQYSSDDLPVDFQYTTPEKTLKMETRYISWDKMGNYVTYYSLLDGKPLIYTERKLVYY